MSIKEVSPSCTALDCAARELNTLKGTNFTTARNLAAERTVYIQKCKPALPLVIFHDKKERCRWYFILFSSTIMMIMIVQ